MTLMSLTEPNVKLQLRVFCFQYIAFSPFVLLIEETYSGICTALEIILNPY